MIQAEDVRKTYRVGKVDVQALRGVSLAVEQGEFVTIVGPSGSGKSTLFYILGGLTHADSGRVLIGGTNFTELSDAARTRMRKSRIGFVFQKFNLLPTLTAQGKHRHRTRHLRQWPQGRLPHRTHCSVAGHRQAPEPSSVRAEWRRTAACRTGPRTGEQADDRAGRRAHRKPDTQNSEIVLNMLRQSNKELGQTVLMITHNPEAAEYGDRIVHMRDGSIGAAGERSAVADGERSTKETSAEIASADTPRRGFADCYFWPFSPATCKRTSAR